MGGKRIAEQVRRALIAAAKVAPVAVAIDAAGCEPEQDYPCAAVCPRDFPCPPGLKDASADAPTDASKDGG